MPRERSPAHSARRASPSPTMAGRPWASPCSG
ncbi:Uncharacterised protein [Bordetella pertussis]|nr:Uncharacterised protein [Bordetella pertussis]